MYPGPNISFFHHPFPQPRTPTGHVDVQRTAAKEGAPQDQALHLRLRALRRHRDAMGKTGGQPRNIRWLHGFFSSISSHHVSKSFQTSRNTPNCDFAKRIIAKICGLNMIERQFWIVLGMQQLDAIGISLAKHMTALERTLLHDH